MSASPQVQPPESSPQELGIQRGMNSWMSFPSEIQVRIFCESGWLFFRGLLTCKRLHQCILRHASRLPASTRSLALEQFVAASRSGGRDASSGLRRMSEAVLEAVVEWIKAGGDEEGRGERLLLSMGWRRWSLQWRRRS